MQNFCFITDLHFTNSNKTRTGSLLEDLCNKLKSVVDYCNLNKCTLIIGGDVFDKPSVPDMVKNSVYPILSQLKTDCYAIPGNHDLLYNNEEYLYKTSYQTLVSSGLVKDFNKQIIDLGECYLSNVCPIEDMDKPIIFVKHAFLNQEDDQWTLHYQDIKVKNTKVVCLLGHDHIVYEPLQYTPNVTIIRSGSFIRGIRAQEHERIPQILHITVDNGNLSYYTVNILSARDPKEIFTTKEAKVASKSEISDKYEDIINKIRNAQVTNMTFEQALQQVADDETVLFTIKLLEQSRLEKQTLKSRL